MELVETRKENRYQKLMKKVIRAGVKTKVLMLSATPVNNRFNDLKNQLQLAYEGHAEQIDDVLNIGRSIDDIFRNAQLAYNKWANYSQSIVLRSDCLKNSVSTSSNCSMP